MSARPRRETTTLAAPNRLVLASATAGLVALASTATALLVMTGTAAVAPAPAPPPLPVPQPRAASPGVVVLPTSQQPQLPAGGRPSTTVSRVRRAGGHPAVTLSSIGLRSALLVPFAALRPAGPDPLLDLAAPVTEVKLVGKASVVPKALKAALRRAAVTDTGDVEAPAVEDEADHPKAEHRAHAKSAKRPGKAGKLSRAHGKRDATVVSARHGQGDPNEHEGADD